MKDFDELLNEVLQSAAAEPRAGLEARVVARVRSDRQRRPAWRLVAWATGVAALPVCIVAMMIWPKDKPPMQQVGGAPAISAAVLPEKADLKPTGNERAKTMQGRRLVRRSVAREGAMVARVDKSLPKLDVFPSPVPVVMFPLPAKGNEGGRQLEELRSQKACEALLSLRQEQNQPIHIAEIKITPLE